MAIERGDSLGLWYEGELFWFDAVHTYWPDDEGAYLLGSGPCRVDGCKAGRLELFGRVIKCNECDSRGAVTVELHRLSAATMMQLEAWATDYDGSSRQLHEIANHIRDGRAAAEEELDNG